MTNCTRPPDIFIDGLQTALTLGLNQRKPTRNNTCMNLLTGGLLVRVASWLRLAANGIESRTP
jgi:hypothetical protein